MYDRIPRIPGHEQDPQAGLAMMQLIGQLAAVQAGHYDVGQQQIDPERIGVEQRQGGLTPRTSDQGPLALSGGLGSGSGAGQVDPDCRSLPDLAVYLDLAAGLL